jgi:hypothetical protein
MRRLGLTVIPILLLLAPVGPGLADEGDMTLRVGLTWAYPTDEIYIGDSEMFWTLLPGDQLVQVDIETVQFADPEGGGGVNVGFELLVNPFLGLDFNLGYSTIRFDPVMTGTLTITPLVGDPPVPDPDNAESADLAASQTGEMGMIPLTLGFNFHVLRTRTLDLYLGPLVGYVYYTDLKLEPGTLTVDPPIFPLEEEIEADAVDIKGSGAWGAAVGLDVRFGVSRWMLSVAGRYLATTAEESGGDHNSLRIDPWVFQVGVGYRF